LSKEEQRSGKKEELLMQKEKIRCITLRSYQMIDIGLLRLAHII